MPTNNDLVLIRSQLLTDIANAIRTKTGGEQLIYPADMDTEILSIETGTTPSGSLNITENGTYDVTNYASAVVNISAGSGSANASYVVTYPVNLENQTIDISDVSTNTGYNGTRTYGLANSRITLTPNTGYRAGTIIVNGVDTNSQNVLLTDHCDAVITVTSATLKPVSDYIMDATMYVGKYVDDDDPLAETMSLGFNTIYDHSLQYVLGYEMYIGSALNTEIEYTQYGSTVTDGLANLMFTFPVNHGTTTIRRSYQDVPVMQGNDSYTQGQGHQSTWMLHIGNVNGTLGTDYFTFTANPYNSFFNNNQGSLADVTTEQNLLNFLYAANANQTPVPIRISEVSAS